VTHPYATERYAQSLLRNGYIVPVPEWGCFVLVRPILGQLEDASGPYPITIMAQGADISGGLRRLWALDLVSVVLVVDDFHRPSIERLAAEFDFVRPFKTHFLHKPAEGPPRYDKHHRYEVRRARRSVDVAILDLDSKLEDWMALYSVLSTRHQLSGIHDLPREHHATLAGLGGVTAIGAWADGELAACHIWVHNAGRVHSHLAASSERGYACGAAYAVNDASLKHFAGAELVNFGGPAGAADHQDDGLALFKRGFANATARSYVCGKVLNHERYRWLTEQKTVGQDETYFPAYRPSQSIE
jgi:hypothetical protein